MVGALGQLGTRKKIIKNRAIPLYERQGLSSHDRLPNFGSQERWSQVFGIRN